MAISFPRDLPFDGAFSEPCSFQIMRQQSQSLTGGASPNVADLGPAYWVAEYRTVVLTREQLSIWEGWLASLRGGLRTFKGRPKLRKWPQMYPRGFAGLMVLGDPFDGTGTLGTVQDGRDYATINDVPDGFTLKIGDYFSVTAGARQHIHRITDGGIAASNQVIVGFEPPLRPDVDASSDVIFEAAYCEMALSAPPSIVQNGARGGSVSFTAQQILTGSSFSAELAAPNADFSIAGNSQLAPLVFWAGI